MPFGKKLGLQRQCDALFTSLCEKIRLIATFIRDFVFVTMHTHNFLILPHVLLIFSTADAYFGYGVIRCLFTSKDDVVYLAQVYLNKMLLGQYNSTLGKYVGYTEKTKEIADNLNKNKGFLEHEKKNKEKCRTNIPLVLDILSRPVKPIVRLRLVESADSKHPGLFMCSAYNFYPKQIKLTWLRDGKEATSNVTSTDELPNGNWLYQIHSYIEISSKPGEKISCVVKHASLTEPKVYDWVPITEAGKNKIAVGAAGLLLALVFPIIGVIFYKRKATGRSN
ncbi:rano class II histocompatibility antigen, A beta chain-like [Neolamprologus brichardi]|uniref:rano class II histocompatibility antigen, A beta chain-like n=1 Tax=Neolamprologus brichardi TaxID=32507 RepID=UPI001643856A|nr:rano class II histocompatibility antigen, A beta chain-like [Neolamprologus brichardi]